MPGTAASECSQHGQGSTRKFATDFVPIGTKASIAMGGLQAIGLQIHTASKASPPEWPPTLKLRCQPFLRGNAATRESSRRQLGR